MPNIVLNSDTNVLQAGAGNKVSFRINNTEVGDYASFPQKTARTITATSGESIKNGDPLFLDYDGSVTVGKTPGTDDALLLSARMENLGSSGNSSLCFAKIPDTNIVLIGREDESPSNGSKYTLYKFVGNGRPVQLGDSIFISDYTPAKILYHEEQNCFVVYNHVYGDSATNYLQVITLDLNTYALTAGANVEFTTANSETFVDLCYAGGYQNIIMSTFSGGSKVCPITLTDGTITVGTPTTTGIAANSSYKAFICYNKTHDYYALAYKNIDASWYHHIKVFTYDQRLDTFVFCSGSSQLTSHSYNTVLPIISSENSYLYTFICWDEYSKKLYYIGKPSSTLYPQVTNTKTYSTGFYGVASEYNMSWDRYTNKVALIGYSSSNIVVKVINLYTEVYSATLPGYGTNTKSPRFIDINNGGVNCLHSDGVSTYPYFDISYSRLIARYDSNYKLENFTGHTNYYRYLGLAINDAEPGQPIEVGMAGTTVYLTNTESLTYSTVLGYGSARYGYTLSYYVGSSDAQYYSYSTSTAYTYLGTIIGPENSPENKYGIAVHSRVSAWG